MTAYDYLESAGEEPKEDDIALMADATTMLAALGRLRNLIYSERASLDYNDFLKAADDEYAKLGDTCTLTREAFYEVCEGIWKDARS